MLGDLRMRWIAHTYIRISSRAYREGFRSRCRSPQSFPSFPVCAYHLADMNNFSKSLGRLLAGYRRTDTKLCELKKRSTSNSLVVVRCQATLTFSLTPQPTQCSWWGRWGRTLPDLKKTAIFKKDASKFEIEKVVGNCHLINR